MSDNKKNLDVMRHSLAHIMAYAIWSLHPEAKFGVGPVIENGFYYDFLLNKPLSTEDLTKIESKMHEIIAKNFSFEKKQLKIHQALEIFKKQKQDFKVELIKDLKKDGATDLRDIDISNLGVDKKVDKITTVSIYQTGDFIDLCRGPHVKTTKDVGAFKLNKVSGAYWRGSEKNPQMQRVYGLAFSSQKELDSYLEKIEEAEKRDHRKLGQQLDLFLHSEIVGAGLPLFTERGTTIINQMIDNIRSLNLKNGFREVRTGHMTRDELYRVSGHEEKFGEDLFRIDANDDILVLKPMNCPHHIQLFASKSRSYRDLPLRYAEFSTLHRNEVKGALGGLTRVRALTQDDAHSFVREDQIGSEIEHILGTISEVLGQYGFDYRVRLSFRDKSNPGAYLGDKSVWEKAEKILSDLAKKFKLKHEIVEGEAAFYGPKMDFVVKDILDREWQVSTIQLDFNLPSRFKIKYIDENGSYKTPVLVHRALNGTFERMLGILIEHYAGVFPTWLAPEQIRILPISEKFVKYGKGILEKLNQSNLRAFIDDSNESLGKKIRNGEMMKIPYLIIIGDKEQKTDKISIRSYKKGNLGSSVVNDFIKKISLEVQNRA